ncbi:MAG TPA: GntR family transcriptional regulator [Capsulimonadaceae bacterium]|jgi:DNA-binding LacI/PurR family transcriptional regulator/DNA-binding transcriptional regulator YhcF (GntR family)
MTVTGKPRRNTLSTRLKVRLKDDLVGRFRSGERIPSERQIAQTYSVSPVTVSRVLQQLSEEGIVYRVPNSGTYLCDGVAREPVAPIPTRRFSELANVAQEASVEVPGVTVKTVIIASLNNQSMTNPRVAASNTHEMMSAAECHIQQVGGSTAIIDSDSLSAAELGPKLHNLVDSGVNSVILLPDHVSPQHISAILRFRERSGGLVPIVAAQLSHDISLFDSVAIDAVLGIFKVTQHLIDLGHTRIAFFGPDPSKQDWVAERADSFLLSTAAGGLDMGKDDVVFAPATSSYDEDPRMPGYGCGRDIAARLVKRGKYTAIVAANDYIAFGLVDAIEKLGLRVPGDVSVTGYDNATGSGRRGLTTVHRPLAGVGTAAAKRITVLLNSKEPPTRDRQLIAPTIVVRSTSGRIAR